MPRLKKQHLKRRKDGRFACRYKNLWFYGDTEEEALGQREAYKEAEKRGELEKDAGPIIAEYALKWLPRVKVNIAAQTYKESAILLEKLLNHIGNMHFHEVKASDIKDVYSSEFASYSDSYIKSASHLYRALFDAAMGDGYCQTNPARDISAKPHKGTESESRAITAQERQWIETLCTDHRAHAAIMAMLYAGIRPQEAKAMSIDKAVNFDAGIISVTETVHLSGSNRYTVTDRMKTKFSKREVPLFPPLRKALEGKKGMLIQSAAGERVTVQAWKSVWESYKFSLETAINGCQERWYGRKKEHKGKELPPFVHVTFTPYDLRHSFCTMCRDNGVEINTCIHWMGHKDAKMILKIYDEYSPERSKKEAEKLEKSLFCSQNGSQE